MEPIARVSQVNAPPKGGVMLRLNSSTNVDTSQMYQHCRAARMSGFPVLQDAGSIKTQPVLIVGDSPDVEKHINEIARCKQAGFYVVAIKRMHDWLLERGITPDAAVACDAQQSAVDIFKRKQPGVRYYLGSICHPDIWDTMRGQTVVVWHPRIDSVQDVSPEWKGVKKVYGGVTTGLRAVSLFWILGHRMQTLVGFASCVSSNGVMRATGGKTLEQDQAFPVHYAGRWFWTTANLAQQVNDLMPTLQMCPGIKLDVIGDGALPHVLRTGKALGWPV